MEKKPWYLSKAVWGGGLLLIGGFFLFLGELLSGDVDIKSLYLEAVPALLGLGVLGIRLQKKEIGF